ncbi:uncharacterized protein LOC134206429 [Armigeres subalbatus]|uniref:uncharacterized protein LOC134206429 n=1 Tax=Armigeres subalbatus TaxID=124917 RepID=UPI002ED586B3
MENIQRLVRRRGAAKGKVSRILNTIRPDGDEVVQLTEAEVKVYMTKLEAAYKEYNVAHDQIMDVVLTDDCEQHEQQYEEFDIIHDTVSILLEEQLTKLDANKMAANVVARIGNQNQQAPVVIHQPLRMPVPTFDGRYESWPKFKAMFKDLVDKGPDPPAVKLYHLDKSLVGSAAGLIDAKTINEGNYAHAWQILEERFENKRHAIDSHVNGLLNLKRMVKKSHFELRALVDECSKHVEGLKFLEREFEGVGEDFVIHLLAAALHNDVRHLWESTVKHGELPDYEDMLVFLKEQTFILERVEASSQKSYSASVRAVSVTNKSSVQKSHAVVSSSETETKCEFCGKSHANHSCADFKSLTVPQRLVKVRERNVCFNCLRRGHRSVDCSSEKSCQRCKRRHHTLLHAEEKPKQVLESSIKPTPKLATDQEGPSTSATPTTALCSSLASRTQQVLLLTAVVDILDRNYHPHPCRILLDSGSQVNLISRAAVNLLGLKLGSSNITVLGVNNTKTHSSNCGVVNLSSRYNDFHANVKCLVTDKVTSDLPTSVINVSALELPVNVQLADPTFSNSSKVDMLLGNEWFLKLLLPGEIAMGDSLPILRETQFGWVVGGVFDDGAFPDEAVHTHTVTMDELSHSIQRFWEVEDVADTEECGSEEAECEEHFRETHRRDASGRYIVELPLKESVSELADSRSLALKRFYALERRLSLHPDLKQQYQDFMAEYESLDHCKEVDVRKDSHDILKWYLPHHAVLRPSNTTTKCRVVFDASAKVAGRSLNDVMKIGAIIQSDLQSIALRFRFPLFVLATDVAKMYRQVLVDQRHTPLTRVFWRNSSTDPLRVLELTTVTYGTASAPFLATRALLQLAIDEGAKYPLAADIVKNSFYVDNALFGFDDLGEASKAQTQLIDMLGTGGFPLHKWASNNPTLLERIPENERDELVSIDEGGSAVIKTLGLMWNPDLDALQFVSLSTVSKSNTTKRQVLSLVSRMFDPLGLVAPVILIGKLLMKNIWKEELEWDDELTGELKKHYDNFLNALSGVTNLRISRHVVVTGAIAFELHRFGDATLEAYGACVYIRSILPGQPAVMKLLCAKSKIVPKTVLTIPRKELLAALLLNRLVKKVLAALALPFRDVTMWSDNQVVLAWLAKNPERLEVFVRNRVSEITATGHKWRYVNTLDNPADIVSRGQSASSLEKNDLWWNGPLFLRSEEYQVVVPGPLSDEEVPELRRATISSAVVLLEKLPVFSKFESFRKMQRVLAYVLRFCQNAKQKVKQQRITQRFPTVIEMRTALKLIVRVVQLQHFGKEVGIIESGEYCKRFSTLNPFLDDGMIRVGGRLRNSSLPYGVKHQWILPNQDKMVQRLIEAIHRENLHIGPSALLAQLRRQFWIVGARSAVRKVTRNCVRCFKLNPPCATQFMGDLPVARCDKAPAFVKVGVDFAGPILIKQTGRKAAPVKGYISVFVCMVTKGIHLELVEDLSADAFVAALLRFVSRRGVPEQIFSDNGTNFVGARNELNVLYKLFKEQATTLKIFEFCQPRQIEWKMIPPNAPHMGGIWEAGVKSTKTILKKKCQSSLLNTSEFSTLLCQIEAQLNSRPLYAPSEDPSELEPLTPGHFMIDRPLTAIPEPSCEGIPVNRLSRWQYVQRLREDFWKRWSQEYLLELQKRNKWNKRQGNIKPGMVVLIKDDNLPPQYWKMGKVENSYLGSDGFVRVVDIRTKGGLLKRPIHKLAPLPILDNECKESAGEDVRAVPAE